MTLERERARTLIQQFGQRRILVVGDVMLDRYIYGVVRRISPEAPVPVLNVTHEKAVPGGASNVAWNIQTLGGASHVAGVIGPDQEGAILTEHLRQAQVDVGAIYQAPSARTTVKTRIIAERQQVVRVDWEAKLAWKGEEQQVFIALLEQALAHVDGVIIEDYGKGLISQAVVDVILARAREAGIPVGYDPKDDHALDVRGITLATPNRKEAYAAVGKEEPLEDVPPLEDAQLNQVALQLADKWGVELLAITLGPQGMYLLGPDRSPLHVPTRAREVYDVSGAGDTVIAVGTLALAAGATHVEAAELANYAAGVVVAQLGTTPCSATELLDALP